MKLIGFEKSNFTTKDGVEIRGHNIYVARDIDPQRGKGCAVERLYLSESKKERSHIDLGDTVGKDVEVYYNRFGKIERVCVI